MLDVREVRKSFDGFQAVDGVSFTVPKGSISAIIGPNGAGKTTLFNLITGHLVPDGGQVVFKERDVTGIAPHDLCRLGMGRSFQRTNIFPRLTVYENVQAAFVCHRGRGWNLFTPVERLYRPETEALLQAVGLLDKADEISGFLSHGNQKQLELGITLMEVVFSIAHRITVLHQGRVIADGAPAEVRRDPEVRRVYLGESR